jgi:hypothetical protein
VAELTEKQKQAILAIEEAGSVSAAARLLGISRSALRDRVSCAAKPDEFREELDDRIADGFELRGYSQLTKTVTGDPIWLKTRRAERDYWRGIQRAVESIAPVAIDTLPTPPLPQSDIIPWLQIGDAHIGLLCSEAETGANFDITIARREICAAAAALIDAAPPCERMVINDLGDGTHYETFKGETMGHGHALDYDTRYWKMIDAYVEICQFICERALAKAQTVDLIYNQGNHSESNDTWIAVTMRALYRNTPRVRVVPNESPFIAYRMGKTLVMVHHGHKAKPEACAKVMAEDYSADWGETTFRYIDGGHVHHSQRKELPGCVFESWNNLAPRDKYANDGGWRSKQLMSLVLRSRTYGEVGRTLMPVERVRDIILAKHPEHYVPPQQRAFAA